MPVGLAVLLYLSIVEKNREWVKRIINILKVYLEKIFGWKILYITFKDVVHYTQHLGISGIGTCPHLHLELPLEDHDSIILVYSACIWHRCCFRYGNILLYTHLLHHSAQP